jgi:hypothetical protein
VPASWFNRTKVYENEHDQLTPSALRTKSALRTAIIVYLSAMTNNFKIDFEGTDFEFFSMNRWKLQLYQVYVLYDGKRKRFHMQLNEEGKFYITDKQTCPQIYLHLEDTLGDAILKLGRS